jgi:hypothetical protein
VVQGCSPFLTSLALLMWHCLIVWLGGGRNSTQEVNPTDSRMTMHETTPALCQETEHDAAARRRLNRPRSARPLFFCFRGQRRRGWAEPYECVHRPTLDISVLVGGQVLKDPLLGCRLVLRFVGSLFLRFEHVSSPLFLLLRSSTEPSAKQAVLADSPQRTKRVRVELR